MSATPLAVKPQEYAAHFQYRLSMSLIPARVRCRATDEPDALFCTFLSGQTTLRVTYGNLYAAARVYAREYVCRGVLPGDVVLIILGHSPHLFFSFLGAMLAGAVPSFMPFPSGKQRSDVYWADHEALFARLRPRAIVSYASNVEAARSTLAAFSIDAIVADDMLLDGSIDGPEDYPGLRAALDDIACLQHSSGTTGLKKGVMLSHAAILAHIDAYCSAIGHSPADSTVSWLPLYHDMGFIACFMLSLVKGTHLIALDPFEWSARPQILLDAIATHRPTLCWLPNFAFSHLVRATKASAVTDLSSIRAFINCSEPCKPATFDRFIERFSAAGVDRARLAVCYAMAENVFAVTQTQLDRPVTVLDVDVDALTRGLVHAPQVGQPTQSLLSCGTPIDGVRIRLCDAHGGEVPAGTVGEIQIAGHSLFTGYYVQPELTRQKLRDGWYATGDLGFINAREIYVTGRVDDMIIINGRNYYAHEIEALVGMIPGVLPGRVAAIGIADDDSDVNGIVVLAEFDEGAPNADDVARAIRIAVLERLGFALARVVPLRTGTLIKTTSGKISRVKNKQMYIEETFADAR